MLDIKFVRNNPDVVKQNIKNKFQDEKLPLVDEVIALDQRNREIKQEVEALRAEKNKASKQIGAMMAQKKFEDAEAMKKKVAESAGRIETLSEEEKEVEEKIKKIMMTIPMFKFSSAISSALPASRLRHILNDALFIIKPDKKRFL